MTRKLFLSMTLLAATAMLQPLSAQEHRGDRGDNRSQAVRITDGPRVEGTGDNWAVIAWTTNTGGSTVVRYGTDRDRLNMTAEAPYADNDRTKSQNHRVHINNLRPGTSYYYQIVSGQGEGTGTMASSGVQEFSTKGDNRRNDRRGEAGRGDGDAGRGDGDDRGRHEALQIVDGPRVEGTGRDWATIAWTTNTGGSSIVRYGTDRDRLGMTAQAPYADANNLRSGHEVHRVQVKNLRPGTTYYFMIDSGQGEGTGSEARSRVQEFATRR